MARLSRKRSDKRWVDDSGELWASRLECEVFTTLSADKRIVVRKCEQGTSDTFPYYSRSRSSACLDCGSGEVVQHRSYTPDMFVYPKGRGGKGRGYYLEVKGFFPGPRRKLLGDFIKTGSDIDLRLLFQSDRQATPKLSYVEYAIHRLKIPCHVWDKVLPRSWYE